MSTPEQEAAAAGENSSAPAAEEHHEALPFYRRPINARQLASEVVEKVEGWFTSDE